MQKLKYKVVKNGIFVPKGLISKFDLIYDENLDLVIESTLRRGEEMSEDISKAPLRLPSKIRSPKSYSAEKLLFLGLFDCIHYGHWLTEGLARYWFLLENNKSVFKIPAARNIRTLARILRDYILYKNSQHWKAALATFGLEKSDFIQTSQPIRAKEIYVPECSMSSRYDIAHEHLPVTRKIALHLVGTQITMMDKTPIYLSRTRLKNFSTYFTNEEPIEQYCREHGFKIVYPELLTLKEQILLFNTHDVFVGLVGSAFHSLLFRFVERKATCVYLGYGRHKNCVLIDELLGNDSVYVKCCIIHSKQGPFECEVEKAIEGISAAIPR